MCGCQLHAPSVPMNARCTCACQDHAQFRVDLYGAHQHRFYEAGMNHAHTIVTTTTATSAPAVTRAVLYGSNLQVTPLQESGPSEAEVAEAIESIKKAMPDG